MPISSNSSPLIALGKTGRLGLLKDLYGTVLIPPSVKKEAVDKGKAIGAADAYEIEKALQDGWVSEAPLSTRAGALAERLFRGGQIGRGEAEAIALAEEKKLQVILDDAEARAVARGLQIRHLGTVMVVYEAFVRRLITFGECVSILTDLSRVLWIAPDVIAEILRRAQEVRK